MRSNLKTAAPPRLVLQADTAGDMMTANPISLRADATIQEAVVLFTDRGISAAPVIDETGRPVGVVSKTDVIAHDREHVPAAAGRQSFRSGIQSEDVDRTEVRDIMTPALFSVPPETPAVKVVEQMLALNVHRLFVVDHDGVLLGVISTFDVLGKLRP